MELEKSSEEKKTGSWNSKVQDYWKKTSLEMSSTPAASRRGRPKGKRQETGSDTESIDPEMQFDEEDLESEMSSESARLIEDIEKEIANDTTSLREKGITKANRLNYLIASARERRMFASQRNTKKDKGTGMQETNTPSMQELNTDNFVQGTEVISPDLSPSSKNSSDKPTVDVSQTMNFLSDTANHLKGLMTGLTANDPDPHLKKVDPEVAKAATGLANSIYKIKRLQLDAMITKHKIENGKM